MASDLATLAIRVDNGDVIKATTSLNTMAVAGAKTEAATQRLTRRMALLEIQAREMDAAMGKSKFTIAGLATSMGATEEQATRLSKAFGALTVIGALGFIGHKTIEETEAAQAAMAQLEAAVKSTGGTAGRTVAQLDELSIALQKQTTFSDEAEKGAETMLLAFNKIKGDQFDRATRSASDLAARMGGDLNDAALKVGKALQDPEHGLTQLRRAGIVFSDSQIAVVKNLYETGRVAEGMNLVLDEMDKKFGGAAAAARDTLGGALAGLKNAWGDLFEVTRGASEGTVTGINAITHALENSGLSMNTILKDATVDWETMRASIEKVRAVMALQIDSKFLQNARNIIERIDFDLNAKIAALNAPAKVGPVSGGATDDGIDAKVRDELARRDIEIAKQRALNAAFGASSATIALLNDAYDARAERAKNAIDHTTKETALLNQRTDAMRAAKDAAVLLAAAEANRKQVTDVQHSDANAVRDARQALELAGLSDEAAAQRRVDLQAENDLAEARLHFAIATKDLDKDRADVAAGILQREQDIYASTVKRAAAVRQLGHDTATVTAEMDRQKKADEEAKRAAEQRAREIRRATVANIEGILTDISNKKNPLIALAEGFKRALIHAISDALAERFLESKFAAMLGIGVEGAAKRQDQAALLMVEASRTQLQAALLMSGVGLPGESTGAHGGIADASVTMGKEPSALGTAVGYGAIGFGAASGAYGAGSAFYSTSHGAAGNYARGAIGGAATGALTGAAIGSVVPGIGTAIGATVGAIVGFTAGIFGVGSAAKASAAEVRSMREALVATMEGLRAAVSKDTLAASIAQAHAESAAVRKQIEDAYSGGGADSDTVRERNKLLAETNALEAERIRQLQEEAAVIVARQVEDYKVRELRAQGKTKEADALAFQEQQQREREDLVRSFGPEIDATEAATLAALDSAQAAEKQAYAQGKATDALNAFTTAVHDAPTGFKIEPYIQKYATGAPFPGQFPAPTAPLSPPLSPLSPPTLSRTSTTGTVATAPITITNPTFVFPNIVDGKVAAKAFLAELDKTKSTTGGLNATRASALELMPS